MFFKSVTAVFLVVVGASSILGRMQAGQDASWQKVAPVGRSFTVLMPTIADQSSRLVAISERESIPLVIYHALSAGKRYVAAEFSTTATSLSSYEKFVAGMEHSLKNNKRTTLLTFDRELSHGGIAGKQYRLMVDQYLGVVHFLRSENAFYLLMVIGAAETDSDAARFLSSFSVGEAKTDVEISGIIVRSSAPDGGSFPQPGVSSPPLPWPSLAAPISGGVLNGKAIELGRPEYPIAARENGDAGAVRVQIIIDELGNVIHAEAIEGPMSLREAAVKAALKSRFTQTRLSGQLVKVQGVLLYNFVRK